MLAFLISVPCDIQAFNTIELLQCGVHILLFEVESNLISLVIS